MRIFYKNLNRDSKQNWAWANGSGYADKNVRIVILRTNNFVLILYGAFGCIHADFLAEDRSVGAFQNTLLDYVPGLTLRSDDVEEKVYDYFISLYDKGYRHVCKI